MPEDLRGKLLFSQFSLKENDFVVMDRPGNPSYNFSDGVLLVVECEIQDEIDTYWNVLTLNGEQQGMCGWLRDSYGVSWKIIPTILNKLMGDRERGSRVTQAFLKMKKFDIQALIDA